MQQVNLGNAIKNDMWITDPIEQPDPDVLPALPGFHVLIRPVSVKSLLEAVGILISLLVKLIVLMNVLVLLEKPLFIKMKCLKCFHELKIGLVV